MGSVQYVRIQALRPVRYHIRIRQHIRKVRKATPRIFVQNLMITQKLLQDAYTYVTYRALIDSLLAEGKTTGPEQTEKLTEYTKMNVHRMSRLDTHFEFIPELAAALKTAKPQTWLVITEGWCGDAANIVPVFNHVEKANPAIQVRFILRDEHLDIMDAYLTNGGRSIPKMVVLDENLNEIATWGPRPAEGQALMNEMKAQDLPYKEKAEKLQLWYARNRTKAIQMELAALIG